MQLGGFFVWKITCFCKFIDQCLYVNESGITMVKYIVLERAILFSSK